MGWCTGAAACSNNSSNSNNNSNSNSNNSHQETQQGSGAVRSGWAVGAEVVSSQNMRQLCMKV
jgi:hypothetical protein